MSNLILIAINVMFFVLVSTHNSLSDENTSPSHTILNDNIRTSLSLGMISAKADEYVYEADHTISHLIWEIKSAPTIDARAEIDFSDRWSLHGAGTVALHYRGMMADYDYSIPSFPWTHRSLSPDTRLDNFFALDLRARYKNLETDRTVLTTGFGIRYLQFQMSSYGGSYIYSICDVIEECFRNAAGRINGKGITYSQRLPAVVLELGASHKVGIFRLDFEALGGIAVLAHDYDRHWRRDLLFRDDFSPSPYGSFKATINGNITEKLELFATARIEKFFKSRGDTLVRVVSTNESERSSDSAGFRFSSVHIGAGLRIAF